MKKEKLSDTALLQIALQSPALKEQHQSNDRAAYPANFRGRVPLKVKMAKDVRPDMPILTGMIAKKDCEYYVWVNKHGAVTAILEDGERLGLLPHEFDVVAWHSTELAESEANAYAGYAANQADAEKKLVERSALFQE